MSLILLCQFTAQHVSDVSTPIFRSLRLLGVLLHRLYCAVMIEVYVLIFLSSGKCYTYIMCRVWLWVSVLQQACGVLWLLNLLVCGMVWWCFMHMYWCLYVRHQVGLPLFKYQDDARSNTHKIHITCFYHVITCVCFFIFYINIWIYCWNYVEQSGKFKINLGCIIISVFASYHIQTIS